jgi:hypothetical protein
MIGVDSWIDMKFTLTAEKRQLFFFTLANIHAEMMDAEHDSLLTPQMPLHADCPDHLLLIKLTTSEYQYDGYCSNNGHQDYDQSPTRFGVYTNEVNMFNELRLECTPQSSA